jgi:cytochrome d ubiquinol oxidase subunit I
VSRPWRAAVQPRSEVRGEVGVDPASRETAPQVSHSRTPDTVGAVMLSTTAATAADLLVARNQMALSLGWHIILACFGVAFPLIIYVAHRRGLRGDDDALVLARRWSKVAIVLFAIGAVSGTILSFEMGLLWPGFMETYGDAIGVMFALEGIFFFLEAIFLGIYVYGWDRLPPRWHINALWPVIASGTLGTFMIMAVNGWMNSPEGITVVDGVVTDVDPWDALFNRAVLFEFPHMWLAAFMVTAFTVAAVYAVGMLRGRRDRLHRLGLAIPLAFGLVAAPLQPFAGHVAGNRVADDQPVKLAAMEGLAETGTSVPLEIGGVWDEEAEELVGAFEVPVPGLLSLLAQNDPDAEVIGLRDVPADERPPVNVVRWSFQIMVALGTALAGLSALLAVLWWRRRDVPTDRWALWALAAAGPAAIVSMEAGWVTTEVGRQPWIAHELMRTSDAVTDTPGLWIGFLTLVVVYTAMTVGAFVVLRGMSARWRAGEEPGQVYGLGEGHPATDGEPREGAGVGRDGEDPS